VYREGTVGRPASVSRPRPPCAAVCHPVHVHPASRILRDLLVAAYRPYVRERTATRGLTPPPGLEEALDTGEQHLGEALDALLSAPFDLQRRSPLELFQEAMSHPTEALAAAGAPEARRDEVEATALPGDRYGLAPASSQSLGEEVWRAHLEWGAAKVAFVTAPTAAVVSRNVMDRSRIESALEQVGWRPASVDAASVVVVDLEHDGAMGSIEAAVGRGARVVAFGPHVDTGRLEAARSAGASVLARSAFFRSPAAAVAGP